MQESFYAEYSQVEDTHWWFRGRRQIFARLLAPFVVEPLRILDIGFGTGAMLEFLESYGSVIGMDMSIDAIRFARTRVSCPMFLGSITHVPIANAAVDLVTAFDIVEHVENDAAAFVELARVCRPGGHVLVTVPAFQFLWGNQDIVSQHRRRYTLPQLGARMRAAGLVPRRLSYFNAILFPAVAAIRMARRLRGAPSAETVKSDFTMTRPGFVNDALTRIFAAEGRWLARWRLPVGVSLVGIAERPAA